MTFEFPATALADELIVVVGDDRDPQFALGIGDDPRASAESGGRVTRHIDGLIHHEVKVAPWNRRAVDFQQTLQEIANRLGSLRGVVGAADELGILCPELFESCEVAFVQRAGIRHEQRADRFAILQHLHFGRECI